MYDDRDRLQKELSAFQLGFAGRLNPENRWIVMAGFIPWDELEPAYEHHFSNKGRPSKRFRVALGTLIVQATLGLTDRQVVQEIVENPYVQFFLGFPGFQTQVPFDASTIVYFRKRLKWESLSQINDVIAKVREKDKDPKDPPDPGDQSDAGGALAPQAKATENKGTLIVDATCAPADIRHPVDLSLLDEARRTSERIIDTLHTTVGGVKPRTYRENARKAFLLTAKNRKKTLHDVWRAEGRQLRYLKRNLATIDSLVKASMATPWSGRNALLHLYPREYKNLLVLHTVYEQQMWLHTHDTRKVPDRIVSLSQPHIRPIIRGKARADTEFGAKISVGITQGFVFVDRMSFSPYNECNDLEYQAEEYKRRVGH